MNYEQRRAGYDASYFVDHCRHVNSDGIPTYDIQSMKVALEMLVDLREFNTVLDCGCSVGAYTHALRALGKKAYGLDFAHFPLHHSSEEVKEYLLEADISSGIPFGDSTFDMVICFDVFEHLHDYEGIMVAAREVTRVSSEFIFLRMPMTRSLDPIDGCVLHNYFTSVNPLPHRVRLSLIGKERWLYPAFSLPDVWEHPNEHPREFWIELFGHFGFVECPLPSDYYIFPNPLMLCSFNTLFFERMTL